MFCTTVLCEQCCVICPGLDIGVVFDLLCCVIQELIKHTEDKQSEKGNLEFAHSEMKVTWQTCSASVCGIDA